MAVAAVHGHCTARVLDRASFPVREAACGRGGLRAFGGPASRPEPSVDKTRPRRAVGIPGARPGPKTSRPTGRQKGGAGARAMLRDVTHAAVLRRPFPPHGNTQNTQHRTRHVFIPRSHDLSGAWPANRRLWTATTGAQKLTTGWGLMMAHLIILLPSLCAATSRHGVEVHGDGTYYVASYVTPAAPSSANGGRSESSRSCGRGAD